MYDNTNLRFKDREKLRGIARSAGADAKVIYLDTSDEIQAKRQVDNLLSNNRHNVEQKWLDKAKSDLEIPQTDELALFYAPDSNLEDFLVELTA